MSAPLARIQRRLPWLSLLTAAPLAAGVAWVLFAPRELDPAPTTTGSTGWLASVREPADVAALTSRAVNAPDPEVRARAVRGLAREGPEPLLETLEALAPDDPQRAQVRAMTFAALGPFADDPRVQAVFLDALQPDAARGERLLALTAVGGLARAPWCRAELERLEHDPDPQVRRKAAWAQERLRRH